VLTGQLASPNVGVGIHDRVGVTLGAKYNRTSTLTGPGPEVLTTAGHKLHPDRQPGTCHPVVLLGSDVLRDPDRLRTITGVV
jgi:hypothetical protein